MRKISYCLNMLCYMIHKLDEESNYHNQKLIKGFKEETVSFIEDYVSNLDKIDDEEKCDIVFECASDLQIGSRWWSEI